jgi:RecJ-like exonuclease
MKLYTHLLYSPNNNPIENIFGLIKNNKDVIYVKNNKERKKSKRKIIEDQIISSINNTFDKYSNILINLFKSAFKYDYINIEKELRDRLIINKEKIIYIFFKNI